MGGCQSRGAQIGEDAAAGAAVGAVAGGLPGAAVGAGIGTGVALFTHHSCDTSKKGIINATQRIIAKSLMLSITNQSSQTVQNQQIDIKCNPELPPGATVYEDNQTCRDCMEAVFRGWTLQHNREHNQIVSEKGKATVKTPIDAEYRSIRDRLKACGTETCKACSLDHVTQTSFIAVDQVVSDVAKIQTEFKNNLTEQLTQTFTQNKDILSAALKVFQHNSDLKSLVQTIQTNIETQITNRFVTDVVSVVQSSQVINVVSTGTTEVNFVTQDSMLVSIQKKVADDQVVTKAFSSTVLDQLTKFANEQSTLGELGQFIDKSFTSTADVIGSSAGHILIGAIIALGTVLLVVVSYFAYRHFYASSSGTTNDTQETYDTYDTYDN